MLWMLNKRPGLNAHKFSVYIFIPEEAVSSLSVISGLVFRAYTLPVASSCKEAKCFHLTVEKKKKVVPLTAANSFYTW